MLDKRIRYLIIFLLILILILGWKKISTRIFPSTSGYNQKITALKVDQINNITLQKDKEAVELTKKDGVWLVKDKKADINKIDQLVNELLPKDLVPIIAQTESKHLDFQVNEASGTAIKINDLNLIVGKSAYPGVYIRITDQPQVYLLKNFSTANLAIDISYWQDKTIVKIDQTKINQLTFTQNQHILTLIKKDNKWQIEDTKKEPNKEKLDEMLLDLASFIASNLTDKEDLAKYDQLPSLTLAIDYDNQKETLSFHKSQDDYLVKRESDGENFVVNTSVGEKFLSKPSELTNKD